MTHLSLLCRENRAEPSSVLVSLRKRSLTPLPSHSGNRLRADHAVLLPCYPKPRRQCPSGSDRGISQPLQLTSYSLSTQVRSLALLGMTQFVELLVLLNPAMLTAASGAYRFRLNVRVGLGRQAGRA